MQGGRRECRKPPQTLYLNDGRYYKRLPVRVFDIRFFFSDSHYDSLPLIAFLSGILYAISGMTPTPSRLRQPFKIRHPAEQDSQSTPWVWL